MPIKAAVNATPQLICFWNRMDSMIILVNIDYILHYSSCLLTITIIYQDWDMKWWSRFNWKLRAPCRQLTPLSKSASGQENDVAQPDHWYLEWQEAVEWGCIWWKQRQLCLNCLKYTISLEHLSNGWKQWTCTTAR